MIAMQYGFILPADYDMTIIDRRIREKGPMLDGFPHLRFKAYLSARREGSAVASAENLYAPFYLWDHVDGLNAFLTGPGFAGVARSFGWPAVRTWMVWQADSVPLIGEARFACREIVAIAPHADLTSIRGSEEAANAAAIRQGALAAVTGFDPFGWTVVRFRLWSEPPANAAPGAQLYTVGHVSLPQPV